MLQSEGKAVSRDEAAMRSKWISQALKLHRQSLELQEEKVTMANMKKIAINNEKNSVVMVDEGDDDDENDDDDDDEGEGEDNEEQEVKKFSGGFSMEQCVAAVRLKAREREEAAQGRQPVGVSTVTSDGQDGTFHFYLIFSFHFNFIYSEENFLFIFNGNLLYFSYFN